MGAMWMTNEAKATHAMGADLTYECIGPNQYRVQLQFFRDCNGITPESNYIVQATSASCGSAIDVWVNQQGAPEVITPLCPGEEDACLSPLGVFGVEQYTYTGLMTLPECAPGGNDWELSWELCCRNIAITTLTIADIQEFYVTSSLDNTVSDCNSSPTFLNFPTPFTCAGQEVFYNHGAVDVDGDSLVFSLVDCERIGGLPVMYEMGFSGTNPLLTVGGVNIDSNTGALSFIPSAVQVGVMCVKVDEYRDNVLIGSVVRDIQFTVISCDNTLPAATDIDGICNDGGAIFEISTCAGASNEFCFDIQSCDEDGDDIVTMEWNEAIPNATFTVTNDAQPIGTFCWTPTADDLGTHSFTVLVADDSCPLLGTNTYTYTIEIVNNPNEPIDAGPDAQICVGESTTLNTTTAASNVTSYTWSPTTGLSNPNSATTQASPASTTVYSVTALYDDGCQGTDEVLVTVTDAPNVLIFPPEVTTCPGASAVFFAGIPTGAEVEWFDQSGTSIGNGTPFTTPPVDLSTTYTAVVTDADGCSTTATSSVNVGAIQTAVCTNIYVSENATGDGSQDNPASLDDAMQMAMCNNTVIKMAAGTYNIDAPLQLSSFLTLEGGFDPGNNWTKSSQAGLTTINRTNINPEGPPEAQRLVAVQGNGATGFRLQDLTITTDDALISSQEGISTYGIHLLGCSDYDIMRCQILPGNASDGNIGAVGADGMSGVPGGNALDAGDHQTGGMGGDNGGDGGDGGNGGIFAGADGQDGQPGGGTNGGAGGLGTLGDVPCLCFLLPYDENCGADPGLPGGPGNQGNIGAQGTAPVLVGGFLVPGSAGLQGGMGEQGGGGGGGGGIGGAAFNTDGGGGGGGGGGGFGGEGGTGGFAGGNSIGIFITSNGMNGNIDATFVQTGNLGQGGVGGMGGQGGEGGIGGQGNDEFSCLNRLGDGGQGGQGGQGGDGGQGANGESHNIFIDTDNPGAPLLNQVDDTDLAAQPVITASNVNCTNLDVDFMGNTGTWMFAPNTLTSGPNPTSGANTTAAFGNLGRYDVIQNGISYAGFHNVALDGQAEPDILTDAMMLDVDTFQLCVGDFASFSTDILADEYNWNFNGAIPNPTTQDVVSQQFNTPSGNTPFEIELFVTTDCCGPSPVRTIYLWVDDTTAGPITGNNIICEGERTMLTLTGIAPNALVTWTPTTGINQISQTQVEVFPLSTTTYVATVTSERNTCPATVEREVVVNENPDIIINPTAVTCVADGSASISISNGSGNFAYQWSHNSGITTPTANNLDFGTYTVTVTDQTTGCMDTEEFSIDPGNAPVIVVQNSSAITCTNAADGMVELGVNGGTQPYNFVWDNGLPPGNTQTGLTSGIMYCVTLTDANNCMVDFCYETFEPPLIDIQIQDSFTPICPDDPTGFIDANVSGGTGGLTYEWSTGADTDIITDLLPGTYTVTVTDDNGCEGTASIDLITANLLTVAIDSTDILCTGDATGEIMLTLNGGTAPFNFNWSDNTIGNTQNPSGLTADTYTVTVTDADGCSTTASTQINEPNESLALSLDDMQPLCADSNEGAIDLTVSGGTGAYTFDWDNDGTGDDDDTEDLSDLPAGIYAVTVTDENGCTETTSVEITNPDAIIATNTLINITCFEGNDGEIDLTIENGTEPYMFDWDNDGTGDNDDDEDLSGLAEDTYNVTITDANGCTQTSSATISAPTQGITANVEPSDVSCFGVENGEIDLTVENGTEPYLFDWDNDGTGDNDDTEDLTDLPEGTYNVTITDANGCTQTSSAIISAPTEGITANVEPSNVLCFGIENGEIDLTVENGTEPYTFDWDNDGTGDDDDDEDLSGLTEGTYNVTITDANGCTQTSSAIITAPTEGISASITPTSITCFGGMNGEIDLTIENGTEPYTFDWDNDGTGDDDDDEDLSGLAEGTYNVTITDANGCTIASSADIIAPTEDIVIDITPTDITCPGETNGTIDLTITNGTAPYIFDWDNDGTGDNDDDQDLADLDAGIYNVTVTDENGCTQTASATIAAPTETINANNIVMNISCFEGNDGQIDLTVENGVEPYMFDWDNDGTGDNDDDEDLTGLAEGTYSVTITDANGCTQTSSATITAPSEGITIASTITDATCFEADNGAISITPTGGTAPYQYEWSNNDLTDNPTMLIAGDYTVTITDANGCMTEGLFPVGQPPQVELSIAQALDPTCEGNGENGTITVSTTGGTIDYTYAWSHDDMLTDDTADNLSGGMYTITVTDANGCTAINTATLQSMNPPMVTAISTDASCDAMDGTATAEVTDGLMPYTYLWNDPNDQDTPIATGLAAGDYTVTVTDANTCTQTATITVNGATNTLTATNAAMNVSCFEANDGQIDLTVENGTEPYLFDWDNDGTGDNDDTEDLTGLAEGIYNVTITDANGCTQTSSAIITAPSEGITANNTVMNVSCFGENNGEIDLTVTNGTEPYLFDWDNDGTGDNDDTEDLTGLAEGTYNVTITDANGCTQTSSAIITAPSEGINAIIFPNDVSCFGGNNGSIDLIVENGVEPYTYDWDNDGTGDNDDPQNLTDLPAGDYSVTITDANNCTQTLSTSINAPAEDIIATAAPTNLNCFGDTNGTIDLNVSNGTAPYTYDWDNDGTGDDDDTEDLTDLPAGDYAVIITDANGCTQIASVSIMQPQEVALNIDQIFDPTCSGNGEDGTITVSATGGTVDYTYSWSHDITLEQATASGLPGGTYTVTVTDTNGCTATTEVMLNEVDIPTLTADVIDNASCGNADGSAIATPMGGTAPYNYQWDDANMQMTDVAIELSAGTYTVIVTDANGCTATATASVSDSDAPIASATSTNATCGESNGTAIAEATGGLEPYFYQWDDANMQMTQTATDLPAGTYNVTITDANGCIAVANTEVTDEGAPTAIASSTEASCAGGDGTATVNVMDGIMPLSFVWSDPNGQTTQTAIDLDAGDYTVTVTDANNCVAIATVTVNGAVSSVTATTAPMTVSCFGGNDGQINLTVENGAIPYMFDWDNDGTGDNDDSEDLSDLPAGNYNVTITDANGCTQTAQAQIDQPAELVLNIDQEMNPTCAGNGENGTISVSGIGGTPDYNYQWSHDATFTEEIASDLPGGMYTITVMDANGCMAVENITLQNVSLPNVTAMGIDASCGLADGSAIATASDGVPPYAYIWDDANSQMTETASDLPAGSYTVTVTDAEGCMTTATASVNDSGAPTASITSTDAICGASNGSASVEATGGTTPYSYQWDDANMQDTQTASNLPAGNYSVTVTDANNCLTVENVTIGDTDLPTVTATSTDASPGALDGTATATATGGTPPYGYQWDDAAMQISETATDLPPGMYNVTVTDANGCTATTNVTVNEAGISLSAMASAVDASCGESNGTATVTASGGMMPYDYLWNDANMQNTPTATNLSAGIYTVSVTDADGNIITAEATVNDSGAPTAMTTSTDASCGAADGTATVTASDGAMPYNYQWDDANMQTSQTASNLSAGTYFVTVTDANNCVVIDNVTIGDSGAPTAITMATDATCGDSDGSATVIPGGGAMPYTYQWDDANMQTSQTASDLPAGNYSVTVTDANACSIIENVTINDTDAPSVIATGTPSMCGANDGTASAIASGGTPPYTYLWDNGEMTIDVTGLSPGIHSVTVTDANDCTAVGSVNIEDQGAPMSTVSSLPTDCGGNVGMATVTPTGGTPPYTYLWSDGQMTATATDLPAGNYTVTITDANNCVDVVEVIVGNLDGPMANTTSTAAACGAADGTATVNPTGGAAPYTYEWDDANSQDSPTASGLPTGNYNVTVTDASGCIAVSSVLVDELPSEVIITVDIVIDASCEAIPNGSVSVIATGGTVANIHDYVWDTDPPTNNPVAQNLAPGTYTVTATDDLGCSATAEVEIGTIVGIMTNETINNVSCFGADDGWVNILLTGGSSPYIANWSNGFMGTDNQGLSSGDYTVTVTDYAGCQLVQTFTVAQPPQSLFPNVEQIIGSNCVLADGSIEVSATGGTMPYIYNWEHDEMLDGSTASNLPAGSYTVTIIDAEGCEAVQEANIPSIGTVEVSATQTSGVLCFGDSNGVATANGTGGTAPYTFTWENSSSTGVIADDLPAGTIGITVTDAAGCTNFTTVEIDAPPVLEVTAEGVATDCNDGGTVSANATGGTGPYVYTWSDGIGTGETITGVDFGNYDLTVTDTNGCTTTISTTLEPPINVDVTVISTPTTCFNTNDGQATATATGGTAPFDFVWDNGETTNPATALGSGTHIVTVTDMNGCESTAQFDVNSPLPIIPQSAGTTPVSCNGGNDGSATIVASGGTGDYTYAWNNGMSGETITDLTAGIYTVSITDGIGCTSTPINVTVVEPLDGVDIDIEFIEPSCSGGGDAAVTAVPEGGIASYEYLWSTGDTGQTAFGLNAGTYTVTVTDANGCTASQSIDFGEPSAIELTYETEDVICFGEETGSIEISSTGGGSDPYVYSLDGGMFMDNTVFGGLGAGSYELNVQDANGCITSETVVINSEFELLADLGADVTISLGDSTELFVQTNSSDLLTYTWTPDIGLSCNDCPNPTVQTFQSMTYQVQVTNAEGCTATDNILVDVDLSRNVFIPNAFSPDNDGANDVFMIFGGQGVVGVNTFKVYDRWGELVWEANNFRTDDPEQGWDGSFRGQNMNPGVFVYYAEVEFIDGVTIVYQGDVTLVR